MIFVKSVSLTSTPGDIKNPIFVFSFQFC
jgi:hypothetical protein